MLSGEGVADIWHDFIQGGLALAAASAATQVSTHGVNQHDNRLKALFDDISQANPLIDRRNDQPGVG